MHLLRLTFYIYLFINININPSICICTYKLLIYRATIFFFQSRHCQFKRISKDLMGVHVEIERCMASREYKDAHTQLVCAYIPATCIRHPHPSHQLAFDSPFTAPQCACSYANQQPRNMLLQKRIPQP